MPDMGRSKAKPIPQPDELTCGPTSLKMALEMLGIDRSLKSVIKLCRTNHKGTTIPNLARAAAKCGTYALTLQDATLRHLVSALKYPRAEPRAVIINYISRQTQNHTLHEDSGHYSTVLSYSAAKKRIYLLDPYTAQVRSFTWKNFLSRWFDMDYKKNSTGARRRVYTNRAMIIVAKKADYLPDFKLLNQSVYFPKK
jgi:ABC-type bacteriocin/lantibiotic exporter with double-glycine peptidase domain